MSTAQHSAPSPETANAFETISDAFALADLREGFVTPLADLGLLAFSGDDAISFLQRQLTNDVEHQRADEARLAGYCTAQGRLLATCLMWKTADGVMLQMPLDILPGLQKRLRMFVLREKVVVADASAGTMRLGLGGVGATAALSQWFGALPAAPYTLVTGEHGTLIRVADAFGTARYEWIAPMETTGAIWPALAGLLEPVDARAWRLADIDAGVPQVTAVTQEKFVAQMINFELIGGVNFRKGCYPGQEIVARTQYLGKSRRRMLGASIDSPGDAPAAGTDVYASDDPAQPCGSIVNVERSGAGEFRCLVSLRLPVPEGVTVRAGSVSGPALRFVPLPYSLPEDGASS